MDGHLQVVVRPEDPLAEIALLISLVDCLLHPAGWLGVLTPDVDEGVMDLIGDGGDDDSLDHLVGVPLQQLAVFECPRLRLVTVDNQIRGSRRGEEAPLEAGREGRSTTSEQTGGLDLLNQLVTRHAESPSRLLVAVGRLIPLHGVGVGRVIGHPLGDDESAHSPASLPTVPSGWKAG